MSGNHPGQTRHVQTVLGTIAKEAMGVTLSHEHCLIDLTCTVDRSQGGLDKRVITEPLSFKNVGHVRYHPLDYRDNLLMLDEGLAIDELRLFKAAGGSTVVDMTNRDLHRDPLALARISKATGLHILMGSGYYEAQAQDARKMEALDEEQITEEIVTDIQDGVDGTGIRSGLIGEIGCSWPLKKVECKVLRAAGVAQRHIGAPLVVHPGRDETAPNDLVSILREVGADLSHTVICHIDRTVFRPENRYKLAEAGCFLAFDLWGTEGYYPRALSVTDVLNDTQRIAAIKDLISRGYGRQILISHDICWKCRYRIFGGHGYAHILTNAIPLMQDRRMSQAEIDMLLIENPMRFYSFR